MSEKYNEQGIKACCANCEWCDKNGYKCKRSGAFVEKFEFCTYYHGPGQTPQMVIDELKKHERAHHDDIERLELALEASEKRIAELQKELNIVQDSERAEAQEADRLRAKVKELGKKLTETVKLLSERSRECGELEAHNEVLQRRIEAFSMELLDRTMKENKDVLERLKEAESEEK